MTDIIIIAIYFIAVLAAGHFFSGRNESVKDYFLAGRKMGWMMIGISVMVTSFSTLNFVSVTGEVFSQGLYVLISVPMFFIVIYPVLKWFIPFYKSADVTSAYEYLEIRFDRSVRTAAGIMFILWKTVWMSVSLYAAGVALASVSSIPLETVILLCGITALIYTVSGGMKAVMVTDMMQFFVIVIALLGIIFISVSSFDGGMSELFSTIADSGRLTPFDPFDSSIFSLSPDVRISIFSTFTGVAVAFLSRYGVDQVVVQRYFSAKNESEVKKGIILNAFAASGVIVSVAVFGLILKGFSIRHGINGNFLETLKIFMASLPAGVSGLLSAALFAAMMSSIDSGINSCSCAFFTDIMPVIGKERSFSIAKARIVSLLIGASAIIFAFPIGRMGPIFETVNKVVNGLGAPLLALFVCGAVIKKIDAKSALAGFISGIIASILVIVFVRNVSLHYYAVINFILTSALIWLIYFLRKTTKTLQI
ncbi:sodium/solute symporter [bacterium]|jgi:SSS family transporter|nr:sodium/solute symporter [bacterium]MDX9806365.1 sodium/solute symporter [bacterium]